MNETASATLVIQIFEFIRRSSLSFSLFPSFLLSPSAFLDPIWLFVRVLTVLDPLRPLVPPSCYPLFSNSSRLPAGQRGRTSLAISGYRCPPGKCVYVRVSLFLPHRRRSSLPLFLCPPLALRVSGITSTRFYEPPRMHG